jgi:phage terminase Nu1 subunit (DNA packaging protein)
MPDELQSAGPLSWLPATCSTPALAALLGISVRAVRDLGASGVLLPAKGRGRWQLLASVHAYHDRLRNQAAGRGANTSLVDERAKREAIEREIAEIRLAEIKGEVLTVAEVSSMWTAFARKMRGLMLAFPAKARSTIPHLTPHDQQTLTELMRDALNDLADEVEQGLIGAEPEPLRAEGEP